MVRARTGFLFVSSIVRRAIRPLQWILPLIPVATGALCFIGLYHGYASANAYAGNVRWHILTWAFSVSFLALGVALGALWANALHLPLRLFTATKIGRSTPRSPHRIKATQVKRWRTGLAASLRRTAIVCTVLASVGIFGSMGLVLL